MMEKPKKKNISRQFMLSFLILILIFTLFAAFSLYDINRLSTLTSRIYSHPLAVSNAALKVNASIVRMHRDMKDIVLFNSVARIHQTIDLVDEEEKEVYRALDIIKSRMLGQEGKSLEIEARKRFDRWKPIRKEVIALVRDNQKEMAANITIGKGAGHVSILEEKMLALTEYANNIASEFMRESERIRLRLNVTFVSFIIVVLIISFLIYFWTIKRTEFAEEELQKSEQRYRSLIENQKDLVSRFTTDGTFIFVNDVYCQFFNKQIEDLIGMNWQPLPVDDDVEIIKEKLSTLSPENTTVIIENRLLSGKGHIHWIQFANTGIFNPDGDLIEIQSVGRDITERKLAEEALRSSEERFRDLAEMMPEALFETDQNLNLTFANRRAFELFGYSFESFERGIKGIEMIIPEDRDRAMANMAMRFKGKDPGTVEYEALREDGSTFPVLFHASPIIKQDGLVGFRGIIVDITDRKQNEERYRKTIESSFDGFLIVDLKLNIIDVNDSYSKMSGYSRNELLDMSIMDIEKLRSKDKLERRLQKIVKNRNDRFEAKHRHKNGNIIDVEISTTYTEDDGGMFYVFIHDITERKRSERALAESEQKFIELFDNSPLSYQSLDENGNFLEVNETWLNVLGYKKYEVIGKNFSEFLHPDWQEHFKINFPRFKAVGEVLGVEFEIRKKDGSHILISFRGKIGYEPDGEFKQTHCVFADITQQRRMEEEKIILETKLQRAQKMESIGTLAGGIAHDFNNILYPIVGHTEMLLEDIPEDSPLRNSLDEIYAGSLRARDLVRQILAFSRQDKNELKLIRIQPIINEALKLLRSTIPTSIEIRQNINSGCGVIEADPTQIHQVVMNLATNAYHSMEDIGGELTVNLDEIEFGEQDVIRRDLEPGAYACLTVADTGIGMDKDLIERIFTPFFTTKEQGKGTGMGLSVVHGIVRNAGGSIDVYSEPGQGTEFRVYLPIVKSSSEKLETRTIEPILGGIERILLVDDEAAIAKMEKQMLERLGYHIVSRTSSLEALEAFRADPNKFDLVITDMAMPNLSGDKLAGELIKIRPDIPILLCTGFSEKIPEEKAASMGIKNFLMKPIVRKDLAKKIREVLDN